MTFRGGTDVFVVVIGGLLYVGWLHSFSQVPLVSYLVPAIAPIFLWTTAYGPLARRSPAGIFVARLAAVGIPLVIALVWAVLAEPIDLGAG